MSATGLTLGHYFAQAKGKTLVINAGVSGHRTIHVQEFRAIRPIIHNAIDALKIKDIYCGGAIGWDNLMAKEFIDTLRVHIVLPFPFEVHTKRWKSHQKLELKKLIHRALEVVVISNNNRYNVTLYQKRNKYIVDNTHIMLFYYTNQTGGTKNALMYCIRARKPFYNFGEMVTDVYYEGIIPEGRLEIKDLV